MDFKNWLEALFDPNITKLKKFTSGDYKGLLHQYALSIDDNGNVINHDFNSKKPYVEIKPNKKEIDLQGLSPQSTQFHRIINAIKSKYPDIENWKVNHYFMAAHMSSASNRYRTVGFWLSKPEIRLANKMPQFFYHGTSTNLWYEGIKQRGLLPKKLTGSAGSYGSQNIQALSHDDLVYLATDPDAATREAAKQAAKKHGGLPLIIRINTTGLDPNKLAPDEDTNQQSAQASIDIASTLAYQGKIPPTNLEPFLIGEKKETKNSITYDWVKFHDVPVQEHPLTQRLKNNQVPYSNEPEYFALLDAGIIQTTKKDNSAFPSYHDVVVNPQNINDQQIKQIIKNSGWTQNVKLILKDMEKGYSGFLYQIKDKIIPKNLTQNKLVKMIIDSQLVSIRDYQDKYLLSLNDYKPTLSAIQLAKMLGNTNFNQYAQNLIEILNT